MAGRTRGPLCTEVMAVSLASPVPRWDRSMPCLRPLPLVGGHPGPALGFALVVTGATMFIINAGVSRVVLRADVDAVTLTTVRVTGTFLLLALIAALFRRGALRPPTGRLGLLVVVHGVIGVAACSGPTSSRSTGCRSGWPCCWSTRPPILVAVWARFVQKERVRNRMWAGLALAMVGLAAATGVVDGATFDAVGIAAGFGAAVCFATYFLVGEHGVGALDPLRVIVWSFFVATLALNLVDPVTSFPTELLTEQVSLLGSLEEYVAPVWALLGWIVVLGTVVPFAVELFALRHLRATTVTMVAMLEPVGVSALGWVWFHERLDAVALLGGVAVVTGIVLAQSARREHLLVEPPHLDLSYDDGAASGTCSSSTAAASGLGGGPPASLTKASAANTAAHRPGSARRDLDRGGALDQGTPHRRRGHDRRSCQHRQRQRAHGSSFLDTGHTRPGTSRAGSTTPRSDPDRGQLAGHHADGPDLHRSPSSL